jgi:hypothetical protein
MVSDNAAVVLSLSYATTLGLGFLSLSCAEYPIGEPWVSILEVLITAIVPLMVTMMAVVHVLAPADAQILSLAALIFMSMAAVVTAAVHLTILVLGRLPEFTSQSWAALFLFFRWPSVPYVLEILAWDQILHAFNAVRGVTSARN